MPRGRGVRQQKSPESLWAFGACEGTNLELLGFDDLGEILENRRLYHRKRVFAVFGSARPKRDEAGDFRNLGQMGRRLEMVGFVSRVDVVGDGRVSW